MSLYGLSDSVSMGNQLLSNTADENQVINNTNKTNMDNYTLANKNEKQLREEHDWVLGGSDAVGIISGLRSANKFTKSARAYDSAGSAITGWANMAKDNVSGGADPKEWLKNNKGVPMAEGNVGSDTFTDGLRSEGGGSDLRGTVTFDAPTDTSGRLAKLQSFGKVSDKVSSGTTSTLDDIVGPEPEPEAELAPGQSDPRLSVGMEDINGKNPEMPTEKLGTSGPTSDSDGLKATSIDASAKNPDSDVPISKVLGGVGETTADLAGKAIGNAGAIIDGIEGVDELVRSGGKHFFDPNESGLSRAGDITQMAGAGLDFLATALPFLAPVAIAANVAGAIMDSAGKIDDDKNTAKGLAAPGNKKQSGLATSQGWSDMGMVASAQSDPVRQIQTSSAF